MRLPRMTRRVMAMAAVLTPAVAGPRSMARPDGERPQPTVSSLVREAMIAADRAPAGNHFLQAAAAILARAGLPDDARRLASGGPEVEAREQLKRVTAIAQARAGDFAGALRSARLLPAPESRSVIALIAAQQAWAGDVPGARRSVAAELGGEPESAYAFRLIAQVMEQKGDFAGAAREFQALPSLKEQARGCRAAARARLQQGDIPGARRAADDSRRLATDFLALEAPPRGHSSESADIEPDTFRNQILREIALEQARRGDARGARRTAEEITQHYSRALVAAQAAANVARAGDVPAAKGLIGWAFELAERAGHRGYELMEIATAETLAGETEAARKTFLRALETVGPSATNQSFIPAAQARAGDLEGAMRTVGAIDPGARQRALRSVAKTLAKAGDVRKAVEIAGGLLAPNERALALQEVGEAQVDAGDRIGALATMRVATAVDFAPDGETLRTLARTLSGLGETREALAWVNVRSDPATRSWGLLGVAEGLLPRVADPSLQLAAP